MLENEDQHQFTLSRIEELEQRLAALDSPDPSLHPRQIVGRRNSFNLTLRQLKQEIADYEKQLLTETAEAPRSIRWIEIPEPSTSQKICLQGEPN
jgi:hypothetical protein